MTNAKGAATFGDHHCHANNCNTSVPPKMLMCRRHWYMVPKRIRDLVWATYVPGQEVSKTPTNEYLEAAREAINAVAAWEESRK